MNITQRPIYEIASDVFDDWGWENVNFAARPYLNAMRSLDKVTDMYGYDSAKSIILYFLGNARAWRGEVAKRVKAELRAMTR